MCLAVIYQPPSVFLAGAGVQLSVTQTCCLEAEPGELGMGGCQGQKLLFPCVICALLVLPCSLSYLVCSQTQSVPPALLALCPQSRLSICHKIFFCDGAQGPALVVYARLPQTSD